MRKASKQSGDPMRQADADLNQIVAYNFEAARELRGWTQEEAAMRLEPLLGQRLPQASISAIERAYREASNLDRAADELGAFFDHLRRVGIRGFVAENIHPDSIAEPHRKVDGAAATRRSNCPLIRSISTPRDQPSATARAACQSRVAGSDT